MANAIGDFQPGRLPVYHAADDASRAMFRALESIVVRARDGQIDRREAVAEAAQISPTAAKAVDWAMRLNLIMLLLAVLQLSYQFQHDYSSDVQEERRERVRTAYESRRDSQQQKLAADMFSLMEQSQFTQRQVLEAVKKLDLPENERSIARSENGRAAGNANANRKDRRAALSRSRRMSR